MSKLVLLDCEISPFCMRVKIALNEKGVEFEAKAEDLLGGNKSELLLTSNPVYKKVPVLLHNGKPLCESTIIVTYIDETWPSPPLLPSSPYERSQARFWAYFIDNKVWEAVGNIWKSKGEVSQEAKNDFFEIIKQLEGALDDKEYFGGDKLGFVDISLIPLTTWFYAAEKIGKFSVEKESPKLTEWIKRCIKVESVAKALPEPQKVYEAVLVLRKMFGIEIDSA